MFAAYFCIVCRPSATFDPLNEVRSPTPLTVQQKAVEDLIKRWLPEKMADFVVVINPLIGPPHKDTFHLVSRKNQLFLHGTSGVAAAWGFHHYLKYYCGCQITWAGSQLAIPTPLPRVPHPGVMITSNDRFRYYANVCTVSYSFVWWNETRWQREVDWMAMNGINLPLAFTGQEAIYQRVYKSFGLTQRDLDDHFGGPAFLAWSRMGNMRGWGGALPQSWIDQQLLLQHKILTMMRSLGMLPVLTAFAGQVPDAFVRHYPQANVSRMGDWGHFPPKFCCTYLLDPIDPLFKSLAAAVIREQLAEYGTNHIYSADTFNEMTPKSSSPPYLASAARAVYYGMTAVDSQAIWLMQGWLFLESFWIPSAIQAYLTAIPRGRMIILDLYSDVIPLYELTESYYGQPFIWCMLHNFGGTLELYGDLFSINTGPFRGRGMTNSSMVGTGLTPEGINQNEVMYEFMNENSWRRQPRNISRWIQKFAERRYGGTNVDVEKAWRYLQVSVYDCRGVYKNHDYGHVVNSRPRLHHILQPYVWYDVKYLYNVWFHLIQASPAFSNNLLFRYDFVDVGRQCLQHVAYGFYLSLVKSYKSSNLTELTKSGSNLLDLIRNLDTLLASDSHFLLGDWLENAKSMSGSPADRRLYEFNARNQITMWGPSDQIEDYASKEWAGLVKSYYLKRWTYFLDQLTAALKQGVKFDEAKFQKDLLKLVEQPFSHETTVYPTHPIGDSITIGRDLFHKYIHPTLP